MRQLHDQPEGFAGLLRQAMLSGDSHQRLFDLALEIDRFGEQGIAVFRHPQPGQFRVDVEVPRELPMPYIMTWSALIHVSFFDFETGTLLFTKLVDQPGEPWWGPGGNGFTLLSYSVPEQLPEARDIICRVSTEWPDRNAARLLGPMRLYSTAASDTKSFEEIGP
jgi:hypothetical protein